MVNSFPSRSREMFYEFYLNGGWRNVTTQVRQTSAVTVSRGRTNPEQGRVAPGKCTFTMHDESGDWNPDNPLGTYYGLFDQGTPFRMGFTVARHAFGGSVSNGWGPTDTGDTWTLSGFPTVSASDFGVSGGVGTMLLAAAGNGREALLSSGTAAAYLNMEVGATFDVLPGTAVSGAPIRLCTGVRAGVGAYYYAEAAIQTDQTVKIRLVGFTGGLTTAVTVPGVTHAGSNRLRVICQVEGNTIRGKVYDVSGPEPYAWQAIAHDTNNYTTGGGVIRTERVTGNTNGSLTVSVDDFTMRVVRHAGEVSSIAPQWDMGHNNRTTVVTSSGVLNRLGAGKQALESAPRRYITTLATKPRYYWPLEEGPGAIFGTPLIGDATMGVTLDFSLTYSDYWGQGYLGDWLPRGIALYGGYDPGGAAISPYEMQALITTDCVTSGQFTFDFMRAGIAGSSNRIKLYLTNGEFWDIAFSTIGNLVVNAPATAGGSFSSSVPAQLDGLGHHYRFNAVQSGGNTTFKMWFDGVLAINQTLVGYGILNVTRISTVDLATGKDNSKVAHQHFSFWDTAGEPDIVTTASAHLGWINETAPARVVRLCTEMGISASYVGSLTDGVPMGPQGVKRPIDLLYECEDADQGTVGEPAGNVGVEYRTRASVTQPVDLTLNYGNRQVGEKLQPARHDIPTKNYVTAKRFATTTAPVVSVQTTGPRNVNDPGTDPEAVGRFDAAPTLVVANDSYLKAIADWIRALGTVPDTRYPSITVEMASPDVSDTLEAAVFAVGLDDRIVVNNLSLARIYRPIDQLARGYTETFVNQKLHRITFQCAPYSRYAIGTWDDTAFRWDTAGTTLTAGITSGATSWQVTVTDGSLWTTDATQFPMDIEIGGEQITLSAISGTSSPQTFTASARAVNGVSKAHLIDAKVRLWSPSYWSP